MISQQLIKERNFQSIVAFCLLMYPILHSYGYGFICLGYLFTLFLMFYSCFVFHGAYLLFPKVLLVFILYFIIFRFLAADTFGYKIAPSTTSMFAFLGFFLYSLKNIRLYDFIRIYRWIAYVNIIIFVIQEIMFYSVGYRFSGIFSFLPLTLGNGEFDPSILEGMSRSSAFFSEPSHFVQFLLPLVPVEIFYASDKKSYFRAGIFIVTLVLLQSGNALFGLAVLMPFLLYYILRKVKTIFTVIVLPVVLLLMIVGSAFFMQTEQGEKILNRADELDSDNDFYASSGFVRIYRGYFVYDEMSPIEKIFGLNDKGKIIKAVERSEVSFTFAEGDLYFNGVQSFLIHNGWFGLFLFVLFLIWLWRGNNLAGRCVLMMLCCLLFMASLFFTHTMLLYIVVVFLMKIHTQEYTCKIIKLCLPSVF